MKKPSAHLAALAVLVCTALVPSAATAQASKSGAPLPPLQLKGGTPFDYCLTDTAQKALADAGVTFGVVAPATQVTVNGHPCMHAVLDSGELNTDLSGLTGKARGGFTLQHNGKRAEFKDMALVMKLDRTAVITTEHLGKRIETLTTGAEGVKIALTKVSAENTPVNLAGPAADAITSELGTKSLAAGQQLFSATLSFDVLQGLTGAKLGL
ncbi:hypothetical protein [Streptomyces sp. Je 1-369]|uniref:hypothetical protein n=1 Tax=Streptomyces sp. Je 1-369 TaxID=2966192 RepID=UPI002285B78F|nr:hypothetical protein [Streptomyces sp. Je 1-369]WAL93654.1 hypothetical protein NOO62_03600 [Streptomyces sp. Je 1-369]